MAPAPSRSGRPLWVLWPVLALAAGCAGGREIPAVGDGATRRDGQVARDRSILLEAKVPKKDLGRDKKVLPPDKNVAAPDKKVAAPDKKVAAPDKKVAAPDKKVLLPDQKVVSPDTKPPCGYSCTITVSTAVTNCSGAVTKQSLASGMGIFKVDLTGYTTMEVTVGICTPSSWVLNIGNSPSNDGYGGDASQFSNDSEAQIMGSTLSVYGNQNISTPLLLTDTSFVPSTGCCSRTFIISDSSMETLSPAHNLSSPYIFRINQPDSEGSPDALLYLGLNRVVKSTSSRTGSGLESATVCLR